VQYFFQHVETKPLTQGRFAGKYEIEGAVFDGATCILAKGKQLSSDAKVQLKFFVGQHAFNHERSFYSFARRQGFMPGMHIYTGSRICKQFRCHLWQHTAFDLQGSTWCSRTGLAMDQHHLDVSWMALENESAYVCHA
jgi:hypothetical protein